ncbi:MAG: hypothetical protein HON90_10715 [Halobacteriovoraceae bacterium]|nr:hypothetical protein [Halobacteriovoraceae bacterium]
MKYLILYFLFLFSVFAHADSSIQFGTGGLTPHFSSSKKDYCNQWNDTGIIVNKSYYLRGVVNDYGFTYIRGNDSICSEIEGILSHITIDRQEFIETGITFGGYAFDEGNWEEYAKTVPAGIESPEPVQIDYFGRNIVPVLALDVAIHLIRRERWSLKLNNLFTPFIFNHSISLEYRFQ